MVKKLVSIKNIGCFDDYSASGDVTFEKLTTIYAENGRGKTMLSAIFRSLRTGESKHIDERKRLGGTGEPEVLILVDATIATFGGRSWSQTVPYLEIFDPTFVNENVFSGFYVDHDHKKNLCRFALGEEGVEMARKLDDVDDAIRRKNLEIGAKEKDIGTHICEKMRLDKFLGLPNVDHIDQQIAEKEKHVESLKKIDVIVDKPILKKLTLLALPDERLAKLLSRSIVDVSIDAEKKVRQHIARCMDRNGEKWIRNGLDYIKDEKCPFCSASVLRNELVKAYRDYFNAAYTSLKSEIDVFLCELSDLSSSGVLLSFQNTVSTNESLAEFWKEYVSGTYPKISFETVKEARDNICQLMAEHTNRKAASPLEEIEIDESLESAIEENKILTNSIALYNEMAEKTNVRIREKKREIREADPDSAKRELGVLRNTKARFSEDIDSLCRNYKELREEKKKLEALKKTGRSVLDKYTKEIFQKYEKDLNTYLQKFGAEFRIVDLRGSYVGGKPRSDYCILINGTRVDLGHQDTPEGTICFRNTLSDGDKSTLAFALFLARLDQDKELSEKIVVFDDPLSSLDSHRKICTQQQITRIGKLAKQVILLSHDAYFLRLLWEANGKAIKTLQIARDGQASRIKEWDIERATQGEYFQNYFALSDYLAKGVSSDLHRRLVARCIRPLLEGNLRLRFPVEFSSGEWLGDFVAKIRESESGESLYCLRPELRELEDVNEYSKKYHHNTNPAADSAEINDAELRSFTERTMQVIGGIWNQ